MANYCPICQVQKLESLLDDCDDKTIAVGEQVANQADLADAASGAAIAAAVNGLRDALVAFGIMAAAE